LCNIIVCFPVANCRDVARHGLGGLEPPSPNKNIAPPNEMKPITPFWLRPCFLQDLSQNVINLIIFDQLKEPTAGGIFVFALKIFNSYFSRNVPKKTKILATSLANRIEHTLVLYLIVASILCT